MSSGGDIPTWFQGDQWTYTIDPLSFTSPNASFSGRVQNLQQTVVGFSGDAYEISISGEISGDLTVSGMQGTLTGEITGTSYQRISDLAQESTILHSEGSIVYIIPFPYEADLVMNSTPALEAFDFPVNVGELWEISCLSTTTGFFSIAGVYQQSLNGSQWVDETVQCDTQEPVSVPAGTFDCYRITRSSADVWYSEDVGNIVKSSVDESGVNGTVHATLTLQSFSRSTQPFTVSENIEPAITTPDHPITISGQVIDTETGNPIQNVNVEIFIPDLGIVFLPGTTNSTGWYIINEDASVIPDDTPSGRELGSGGVVARCIIGNISEFRVKTLETIADAAPAKPSVNGPSSGKIKVPYNCTIVAVDPDGDQVTYFIDWGDNTSETWPGVYDSDVAITVGHTFASKGTYTIKVKAIDVYGAESEWGYLSVKMPISTSYDHHPILTMLERFFERHPYTFPILRQLFGCGVA